MEDVKEQPKKGLFSFHICRCFNPCFNGRCKRTFGCSCQVTNFIRVSILVLMEDVKEPTLTMLEIDLNDLFQSLF